VGLDQLAGFFVPAQLLDWAEQTGRPLATIQQVTAQEVAPAIEAGRLTVIDVREPSEFQAWTEVGLPVER
jgi:hypothetical protein